MNHMSQAEANPSCPSSAVQRVFRNGSVTIVWLSGEHDAGTAPELRRFLIGTVVADLNDLVIDLTGVTFMDAATLGALMSTRNVLRKQDRFLTVRGSPRCVDRLFEICDVTSFFDARPSTTGRLLEPACADVQSATTRRRTDYRLCSLPSLGVA